MPTHSHCSQRYSVLGKIAWWQACCLAAAVDARTTASHISFSTHLQHIVTPQFTRTSSRHETILDLRAGGSQDNSLYNEGSTTPSSYTDASYNAVPNNPEEPYSISHTDSSYPPDAYTTTTTTTTDDTWVDVGDTNDPFHETVQDRVNQWRTQAAQQAAMTRHSPRDEQGRMKLLTSVSRGSRALIFFILVLRNLHLYEVADAAFSKGLTRFVCVGPLMVLFVGNLMGCLISVATARPSHAVKKRLKAILNLDKVLELSLGAWSLVRLTIWPSAYTPRELYMAKLFHSIFFFLQCQTFTRLSWEDGLVPGVTEEEDGSDGTPMEVPWVEQPTYNNDVEWYRKDARRSFGQSNV
jgi:hypothetical protein